MTKEKLERLKSMVCDIRLAARLQELGVDQKSQYGYFLLGPFKDGTYDTFLYEVSEKHKKGALGWVSAFTAEELGQLLPVGFECGKGMDGFYCKINHEWAGTSKELSVHYASTEADCRALLLIEVLENLKK